MSSPQKTLSSTVSTSIKFLCSYGGKILPRPYDGRLRYIGGVTRVISVHRSISFSELMNKLNELCGYTVSFRCQLPSEDLDVLVSVKSDEELANVIEEYDKASSLARRELKIRAILSSSKSSASSSPSSSFSGADLSPGSSDRVRSPEKAVVRRFQARNARYGVVRNCYYYNYPCHLQANHNFSQHSNYFWH